MRVLDVAKELGIESKVALAKLRELGIPIKNHFNALSLSDESKLRAALRDEKSVSEREAPKAANRLIIRRRTEAVPTAEAPSVEEPPRRPAEKVVAPVVPEIPSEPEEKTFTKPTVEVSEPPVRKDEPALPLVEPLAAPQVETPPPVSAPQLKSSSSSYQRPTPTNSIVTSSSSSSGAVIVRRASPADVAAQQQAQQQPSSRPGSSSQGPGAPRRAGFTGGGVGVPGGTSRPFVMPEAPSAVPSLAGDKPRHRDKERDHKRKSPEEESLSRHKASLKARGLDEDDEFEGDIFDGEGSDEITVRTILPNRKRPTHSRKKERRQEAPANPTRASKKVVRVDGTISVNDLAGEMSVKAVEIIRLLMRLGMMASINQVLDFDTVSYVAAEFGFEAQNVSKSLEDILAQDRSAAQQSGELTSRPPIITIMGHVDHGKTSLLDAIRSTSVAQKEAGGITQHIGAYQVEHKGRKITFLDTPGHEAFTSMRARGAKATDVVILVVAADDGVMPQTKEAIAHARAAQVPLVVAINKIDKPSVDFDRIYRELAEEQVISEEWGGDTMFVKVSAKTRVGLEDLMEAVLLQADVLELKAPQEGLAEGVVIESRLDKFRGTLVTVIVTAGILKQQDIVVVGRAFGRVRALFNDQGVKLAQAKPGDPVEISGLDSVPEAGEKLYVVVNESIAREAVAYRIQDQRQRELAAQRPLSLEERLAQMKANQDDSKAKELPIILKADTHGSVEAIRASLHKLDTPKVKTKILLGGVGGITETDVTLAQASKGLVLGFNVRPDKTAAMVAEKQGVSIECFNIIYELVAAVEAAMVGSLAPVKTEKVLGHAEIRNTFSVPKMGMVAGCYVLDGKVQRNAHVRLVRDGIVVYTGRVGSLKRFKDDAKEVLQGFECGLSIDGYNDIKVGDQMEVFVVEEIAATLA